MVPRGPRFTVAITVWERPELALRALLSVLNQSYANWECVVLGDGPAPEAEAQLREFGRHGDPRAARVPFHALPRRPDLWGNHLRRRALRLARGNHCVILSHDCALFPGCLAEHARLLRGRPDVLSIVGTHMWGDRVLGDPHARLPRLTYAGAWPRGADAADLRIADVELTGLAFPAARAYALGCFSAPDQARYAADYLAYERLVRAGVPVARSRRVCAAHF